MDRCKKCGELIINDGYRGREKDGSFNYYYCLNCYNKGSFTGFGTDEEFADEILFSGIANGPEGGYSDFGNSIGNNIIHFEDNKNESES